MSTVNASGELPGSRRPAGASVVRGVVWALLALVTAALLALAVFLLVRMRLFSSSELSDDQLTAVWAFLGVALGTVATLIGALLTDQNNRRADRRAAEAENRLVLDTRAKVLELITDNGAYAQKGRVAGAVATLVELRGGPVAIRLLGDVWEGNHIGTTTAVWLISQILESDRATDDEKTQAAALLSVHAGKLLPRESDPNQDWYEWPDVVDDGAWPVTLPLNARVALVLAAGNALRARPLAFWMTGGQAFPIFALEAAFRNDPDPGIVAVAALTLTVLLDSGLYREAFGEPEGDLEQRVRDRSGQTHGRYYDEIRTRMEGWAAGEAAPAPGPTAA